MIYRDWNITYDPPPIPDRRHDYQAVHEDYDGPDDGRCITAGSIEEAKQLIDDWYEDEMD